MSSWIANAASTVGAGLWSGLVHFVQVILTIIWDTGLTLLNFVLPKRTVKATLWPPFVPRVESDSRSPCPGLNALASHGILPHDGRGIKFTEMAANVQKHYNCAPSLCRTVCGFMANVLHRNYHTDTLDLGDMCLHNGIEHDASMTRFDAYRQPDQSTPSEKLIYQLLESSKDGKTLTPADFSRFITTRRIHSKTTNPQFSLDTFHSAFGAGNAATLLLIFGGEVATIKPFLLEERIPDGWTSHVRARMGLTMASFNATSMRVLLGVQWDWKRAKPEENVHVGSA